MKSTFQTTIQKPIYLEGVGLHSGKSAKAAIHPAAPGTGIVFARTDLEGAPELGAHFRNVTNTRLATTLGFGKVSIATVEHLLSALHGVGIDNAIIEVSGPELPILDGSAAPFVDAILSAGIEVQIRQRPVLVLKRTIEVRQGDRSAIAEPSSNFEVHAAVQWDHPLIGEQSFVYKRGKTAYSEISSARTFCLYKDVENLHSMGLALGGSLNNALVLDHEKVLNPEGLRFKDEFVRHKVLDALGDFKLAGIDIQARFKLNKSGHELHYQLLSAIFKDSSNFEIVGQPEDSSNLFEFQTLLAQASRMALVGSF
jgi:UDP-3-O-[3-hydroxymyristoyl] N-acetylglucosamine deacetylase